MTKTIGFAVIVIGAALSVLAAGVAEQSSPPATQPSTQPAKELTLDLGNKVTMKLALIPAGKFMMGSPKDEKNHQDEESPQREVTISKPFYIGVYEVTQEQYERIMGKNPSGYRGANYPVGSVSWQDAVEFCRKLSLKTGKAGRLPTEAEWEYACRAGSTTEFCYGEDPDYKRLSDYGWYKTGDLTHPVGQKKPNAFGLYDMYGNVFEWCADWAGSYADADKTDPTGPGKGGARVLRGGSCLTGPEQCRSASRFANPPDLRPLDFGFRVVVTVAVD